MIRLVRIEHKIVPHSMSSAANAGASAATNAGVPAQVPSAPTTPPPHPNESFPAYYARTGVLLSRLYKSGDGEIVSNLKVEHLQFLDSPIAIISRPTMPTGSSASAKGEKDAKTQNAPPTQITSQSEQVAKPRCGGAGSPTQITAKSEQVAKPRCGAAGCEFYAVKDGLCTGCNKGPNILLEGLKLYWKQFIATPAQFAEIKAFVVNGKVTASALFGYLRSKKLLLTANQAYEIVDLCNKAGPKPKGHDLSLLSLEIRYWDAVCCRVHDWKTLKSNYGREGYYEAYESPPLDWNFFAPLANDGSTRDPLWEKNPS